MKFVALKKDVKVHVTSPRFVILGMSSFDQVCQLETLCYPFPWSPDLIKAEFEKDISLRPGIFIDNFLIGSSFSYLVQGELHILNLAIHPSFRQKGYGKALLSYLLCLAINTGARQAFLEVRESNIAAQALYKNLGFSYQYTRHNYYKNNNESALILYRKLNQKEFKKLVKKLVPCAFPTPQKCLQNLKFTTHTTKAQTRLSPSVTNF